MLLLVVLGLISGVLTTLAGMGGGMVMLSVLTVTSGPHTALALSSPALFVSNSHRAYVFRKNVDRRILLLIAAGALPGALVGGLLLPAIPDVVIKVLLVLTTALAIARAKGWIELRPRSGSLAAAGAGVGALSATSGGAGMLLGPVIMSAGLSGMAFVGTIAACAVTMHLGRIGGYLASGLITAELMPSIGALMIGLIGGNLVGLKVRHLVPKTLETKVELGALVLATTFAVLGIAT